VLRDPPALAELLPRVRLVVHHAGLGTAHAALLAGTPQVVLPERLEHRVTAQALWGLGVAAAPGPGAAAVAPYGPARHAAGWAALLRPLATPAAMLGAVLADASRLLGAAA
jgi:hypothetical protein